MRERGDIKKGRTKQRRTGRPQTEGKRVWERKKEMAETDK